MRKAIWVLIMSVFVCPHVRSVEPVVDGEEILGFLKEAAEFLPTGRGTENDINYRKFLMKHFKEMGLEDVHEELFLHKKPLWSGKKTVPSFNIVLPNEKQKLSCTKLGGSAKLSQNALIAEAIEIGIDDDSTDDIKAACKGKIVLLHSNLVRLQSVKSLAMASEIYETLVATDRRQIKMDTIRPPKEIITKLLPYEPSAIIIIWDDAPEGDDFTPLGKPYWSGPWQKKNKQCVIGSVDGAVGHLLVQASQQKTKIQIENTVTEAKARKRLSDKTANVVGMLPGMTDEFVIIGGHINGATVINNFSGNACVYGIAKYFSQVPKEERKRTLIFLGIAAHDNKSLGAKDFVKRHQDDIIPKTCIMFNIDHVAGDDYTFVEGKAQLKGKDAFRPLYVSNYNEWLIEAGLKAIKKNALTAYYMPFPGMPGDSKHFSHAGVPAFWISTPQKIGWSGLQRYRATHLERQVKTYIDVIQALDNVSLAELRQKDAANKSVSIEDVATQAELGSLKKIMLEAVDRLLERDK